MAFFWICKQPFLAFHGWEWLLADSVSISIDNSKGRLPMIVQEEKVKQVLRFILGLVFVVSAITKAAGPELFLREVDRLSFFTAALDRPIAYAFILFEFVLGWLIIFRCGNRVLFISGLTIFILSLYLAYKVLTNDTSDCGCFGNFIYRSNLSALVQDLLLLTGVVYLHEEKQS